MGLEIRGELELVGPGVARITGIGKHPALPLHQYWSVALRAAADSIDGDEGPFTIQTQVLLKHESPGWVDGFIVALT